ncbi:MAG: type 2 isopentenyl-diphosphate Delta-isomerase [Candidatus Lokiarchaeota archaeon]|nr:type 2 isopentenyl-diphosphate Delta-isomerase [Candidatus Lokiarchaeota archaeon]
MQFLVVIKLSRETESRKLDHIKISLDKKIEFNEKTTGFEDIELIHHALPELNLSSIDTKITFLKRKFNAPILIEAMTGGNENSKEINEVLAKLALEFNVPMGIGSQRAGIENKKVVDSYKIARNVSKDIFLIGNIGGAQLVKGYGIEEVNTCIEMIEANAIAIHLNPLQESLQKEGDKNFKGILKRIEELKNKISVPIIIKETGCGFCKEDLRLLKSIGVKNIDISGAGGTSWAAVEHYRNEKYPALERLSSTFWDWGIPTVVSTIWASEMGFDVISSGGIRNGLDIAKAINCGALIAGMAHPFLKHAFYNDLDSLKQQMEQLILELKTAMFLTKSGDIHALMTAEKIIQGKTKNWLY